MSLSILSRYLIRLYLEKFFLVLLVISSALLLSNIFDLLNKMRGATLKTEIFIQLIFLKLPYLLSELLPLNSMLAMFIMHYMLARRNELAIICGSGVSIFMLIMPISAIALALGIFVTTLLNPISTYMLAKYESMEDRLLERKPHNLVLSNMGIIISEYHENERRIYIVKSLSLAKKNLQHVTILFADQNNNFMQRIEAENAHLDQGNFTLNNVRLYNQYGDKINQKEHIIHTILNIENFLEGLKAPDHIDFWQLPETINNLVEAGFPVIKHQLYYYKILFRPISMVAYIFLAFCFMFKDTRSGDGAKFVIIGVFIGFIIYLMTQIISNILVYSGVNALVAMALPTIITILLSSFVILHLRMG